MLALNIAVVAPDPATLAKQLCHKNGSQVNISGFRTLESFGEAAGEIKNLSAVVAFAFEKIVIGAESRIETPCLGWIASLRERHPSLPVVIIAKRLSTREKISNLRDKNILVVTGEDTKTGLPVRNFNLSDWIQTLPQPAFA